MIVGTYNCGKDDGEWVIGHLWCDVGKWMIRQFEYDRADYVSYEVDPETVCQYTGLTDKNGKKIWENDIVEISGESGYFKVEWEEDAARWIMNNESEKFIVHFDNYWSYEVEVVGNIFDNPDLLNDSQ